MAVHRYQVSVRGDSDFARDQFVNNVYLNHTLPGIVAPEDLSQICQDMAEGFRDGYYQGGGQRQIVVTAYDVGVPPNFPLASEVVNSGFAPGSTVPREVALCLSFYADRNQPRRRGRLFLPLAGTGDDTARARPLDSQMNRVLAVATMLSNLGGADVDWSVYSQVDHAARKVTNAWVDDEWDTVRSRGLRATKRMTLAVDE